MEELSEKILQNDEVSYVINVEPEGFEYCVGDIQHMVFYDDEKVAIVDEETGFFYDRLDDEGNEIMFPLLEDYLEIRKLRKLNGKDPNKIKQATLLVLENLSEYF